MWRAENENVVILLERIKFKRIGDLADQEVRFEINL